MQTTHKRLANGLIDYDHYRREAAAARREARTRILASIPAALAALYGKLAQIRTPRRAMSKVSAT